MPRHRAVPGDGSRALRQDRQRLPGRRHGRVGGRAQRRARRRGRRVLSDRGDRSVPARPGARVTPADRRRAV
ncbi:Adenosylhomocysteinase [Actinacidiphila bryophytorum]|uniref:Adenosylhomocysteinase n=1 Tax=Actinacidiphila bryophytorum TaxID=1436133 RepID=A0A9W4MH04_9ACTN|nr:Adenosylhomocysteinase [Actinacidiphila bryophytorum]